MYIKFGIHTYWEKNTEEKYKKEEKEWFNGYNLLENTKRPPQFQTTKSKLLYLLCNVYVLTYSTNREKIQRKPEKQGQTVDNTDLKQNWKITILK